MVSKQKLFKEDFPVTVLSQPRVRSSGGNWQKSPPISWAALREGHSRVAVGGVSAWPGTRMFCVQAKLVLREVAGLTGEIDSDILTVRNH